jgi:cytosine/adenosine deaminase-related metal-dependent hydrolase
MTAGNQAIALVNAEIGGRLGCLRMVGDRIASVGEAPGPSDRVVDLGGDCLLPGLINAHDHLQLNNYPRIQYRDRYSNAGEWIDDIDSRRDTDPRLASCAKMPRAARLLQGGLKNLLCGATTVAHHDPAYPELDQPGFPVRVVRDCGWAHSLHIDGDDAVRRSHAATPPGRPWIVHAGEGVDSAASAEFDRLDSLGCVTANSVLVHGVGFTPRQLQRLVNAGAALAWCPGSNLFLFGHTPDVATLAAAGALLLGSDSRLSGERDLLAELALAATLAPLDAAGLVALVTSEAARVLRLPDRGALVAGNLADLVILPAGLPLHRARRADLRAVIVGGRMRYGDAVSAAAFAGRAHWSRFNVDGVAKYLAVDMATRLRDAGVQEPGCELFPDAGWRAA